MIFSPDLFGSERPLPRTALRPADTPIPLSLFDHAAELAAIETGRAVSQEHAEVVAPPRLTDDDGSGTIEAGGSVTGLSERL